LTLLSLKFANNYNLEVRNKRLGLVKYSLF
jgi:hypothetical protein